MAEIAKPDKQTRQQTEYDDPDALTRHHPYYDPIYTLPEPGQRWWRQHADELVPTA